MKTTIELPDSLFREAKATAARRGISMKEYFRRLVENSVARGERSIRPNSPDWPVPPPDVPKEELRRIHALIEEEFERIDPEDWK